MSDEWNVESEAPRKKGGLPAWFWWTCGTGCLLTILAVGAVSIFGYVMARQAADPERVKVKLANVLPTDAWPEGYVPRGTGAFGVGVYVVEWPDPSRMATVSVVPGRGDVEGALDPDAFQNTVTNDELEAGELEVKGRRVKTLRFKDFADNVHLRVDISGEKSPYATLELVAPRAEDAERLEEAVQKFLEPFDIWRGED